MKARTFTIQETLPIMWRAVRNHVGMLDFSKLQERQVLEGFEEITLKDFMK